MGHYQTQTVYAALVTTYYWPHIREDIIHYIKHCGPCIRHHLEPEINHSAQVINPIKIFDLLVQIWFLVYLSLRKATMVFS